MTDLITNLSQMEFFKGNLMDNNDLKYNLFTSIMISFVFGIGNMMFFNYIISQKNINKMRYLSHLMSCLLSGTLFMFAIANIISTSLQINRNPDMIEKVMDDNKIDLIMIQICIQGIFWDLIMGYELYPKIIEKRYMKYVTYIVMGVASILTLNMKIFTFYWISEYVDFLKNYAYMIQLKPELTDKIIYQISYFVFKLVYPIFLVQQIYIRNLKISNFMLIMYMGVTWYEVCLFLLWSLDNMRNDFKMKVEEEQDLKKEKEKTIKSE